MKKNIIGEAEAARLRERDVAVRRVVMVDDFAPEDLSPQATQQGGEPWRSNDRQMRVVPVYVVDGARTPFLKVRNKPGPFTPVDLAVWAGRRLLLHQPVEPDAIDEAILGRANPRAASRCPSALRKGARRGRGRGGARAARAETRHAFQARSRLARRHRGDVRAPP